MVLENTLLLLLLPPPLPCCGSVLGTGTIPPTITTLHKTRAHQKAAVTGDTMSFHFISGCCRIALERGATADTTLAGEPQLLGSVSFCNAAPLFRLLDNNHGCSAHFSDVPC